MISIHFIAIYFTILINSAAHSVKISFRPLPEQVEKEFAGFRWAAHNSPCLCHSEIQKQNVSILFPAARQMINRIRELREESGENDWIWKCKRDKRIRNDMKQNIRRKYIY